MKKEIIILFLLMLPYVSAQELNLSQLVLIMPLILTGILILFFLVVYIKDHIKSLSSILPNFKFVKKHKEIKQSKIIIDFKKELNLLEKRSKKQAAKDSLKQLSGLLKDFLKQIYNIQGEFTYTDLNIKDQDVKQFLNDVSYYKYSDQEISQKTIFSLINEFSLMVKKSKLPIIMVKRSIFSKIKLPNISFFNKLKEEYVTGKINFFKKIKGKKVKSEKESKKEHIIAIPKKSKLHVTATKKSIFSKLFTKLKEEHIKAETKKVKKPLELPHPNITSKVLKLLAKINPIIKLNREILRINNNLKEKNHLKNLNCLLKESKKYLMKDIKKANVIYSKALFSYYNLPINLQKYYANKILNLHNRIETELNEQEKKHLNRLIEKAHNLKKVIVIKDPSFNTIIEETVENIRDHYIRKLLDKINLNGKEKPTEKSTKHLTVSTRLLKNLGKAENRPTQNLIAKVKEDFNELMRHLNAKPKISEMSHNELVEMIKSKKSETEQPNIQSRTSNKLSKEEKKLFNKLTELEKEEHKHTKNITHHYVENTEKEIAEFKKEFSEKSTELSRQERAIFEKLKHL